MKKKTRVECSITLKLDESEMRAFDAISGYGVEGFLEFFYKHMGKAYLKPHEAGLRSLFEARALITSRLSRTDRVRKELTRMKLGEDAAPETYIRDEDVKGVPGP